DGWCVALVVRAADSGHIRAHQDSAALPEREAQTGLQRTVRSCAARSARVAEGSPVQHVVATDLAAELFARPARGPVVVADGRGGAWSGPRSGRARRASRTPSRPSPC